MCHIIKHTFQSKVCWLVGGHVDSLMFFFRNTPMKGGCYGCYLGIYRGGRTPPINHQSPKSHGQSETATLGPQNIGFQGSRDKIHLQNRLEKNKLNWLVVEPPHVKNMIVKMGIFPDFRGENTQYLKPLPSKCGFYAERCDWFPSNITSMVHKVCQKHANFTAHIEDLFFLKSEN